MSSITSETPSSRALKQLSNRNNVADLYLRQRLDQMEREKNFYMSYLDKDRLDITDFLKNLQKCDSDLLPQSKLIKEEMESDEDWNGDVAGPSHSKRRNTHTAKTAPPRLRVRRFKDHTDDDDDDDDEDDMSLDDHHPRRQIRTSVPTRRQMLAQRKLADERAMESQFDKTETFLRHLRHEAARDDLDDIRSNVTRREFTAYLLNKVRLHSGFSRGAFWSVADDEAAGYHGGGSGGGGYGGGGGGGGYGGGGGWGEGEEEREGEEDETWAQARMDMVYPIRRLGNIASRFQKRGDNNSNNNNNNSGSGEGGRGGGGGGGGGKKLKKRSSSSKKNKAFGDGSAGGGGGGRGNGSGGSGKGMRGGGGGGGRAEGDAKRIASAQRDPRQHPRSIFEITADDPPPSSLPRPAGMPDFHRSRRDTVMDTARAYGFGEAAVVAAVKKASASTPPPRELSASIATAAPAHSSSLNPFSRAGLAERRRAERAAKAKQSVALAANTPTAKDDPKGTDMIRALLAMKSRFKAKPLDDRVKDFMTHIEDLKKSQSYLYQSQQNL